jgi:hypothetical protein|tara:strand:+ start:10598 stop:11026 length:429 start_codon:yes stop_codon:yes gene_type:complete
MTEDTTDIPQEEIQEIEEELDGLDQGYGSPEPPLKDNVYKFFREILEKEDSTRIGNLKTTELGQLPLGVRSYLEIGGFCDKVGLEKVAAYLKEKAMIVTSTSMSKDGFLAQLFVTQIKKEQKVDKPLEGKKPWFGGRKQEGV